MDQQTVDKVLGFLREAAGQLGVGFEYAWPAVVRYMWAQALGTTLVLVFGLIMMWVLAIKAKNWLVAEDESIPDDSKDKGVPSVVALVILGSACIISGLILLIYEDVEGKRTTWRLRLDEDPGDSDGVLFTGQTVDLKFHPRLVNDQVEVHLTEYRTGKFGKDGSVDDRY